MESLDSLTHHTSNKTLYEEFISEIQFTIEAACEIKNLKYANIKGRVKSADSLKEKIERQKIQDQSEEIYDYAGVRLVCLFEEEKDKFAQLVEDIFTIAWKSNKKEELGANKIGYQSLLYCVKFSNDYTGPRYNKFKLLVCEIQITTVLLEAWALINHSISYKNESSIPLKIQRDLNLVSSLLEVAQKVFDDSYDKRKSYISMLQKASHHKSDLLSQLIDFDTLSIYSKQIFPELEISEHWQNELIKDLDKTKYKTLKDIDDAVNKAKSFVSHYKSQRPDLFTYSTDFITKSLGFIDLGFRQKHNWSEQTIIAFERFLL